MEREKKEGKGERDPNVYTCASLISTREKKNPELDRWQLIHNGQGPRQADWARIVTKSQVSPAFPSNWEKQNTELSEPTTKINLWTSTLHVVTFVKDENNWKTGIELDIWLLWGGGIQTIGWVLFILSKCM